MSNYSSNFIRRFGQQRFRKDLIVTPITQTGSPTNRYLIKEPSLGEIFEFGEEEYFLCQSMDGVANLSQILDNFQQRFGYSISEEELQQFFTQIEELGLLEVVESKRYTQSSDNQADQPFKQERQPKFYKLVFFNPNSLFRMISGIFSPIAPGLKILVFCLFLGFFFAGFTLWNNSQVFWQDTVLLLEPISFLQQFIVTLFVFNLTTKIAQGTVCFYQGGTVREFGLTLAFGVLPFFYISKDEIWQLERKQQLWIFGTPLLYRLFLFTTGILVWYGTRGTGTALATGALVISHAAISSFLFLVNPFWPSDGYGWLINFFHLPKTSLNRAFKVWGMMLDRRPLPKLLTLRGKVGLILYGLITVVFWSAFLAYGAVLISASLERNFQGGGVLLFLGIFILFVGWCWWITSKFGVKSNPGNAQNLASASDLNGQTLSNGVSNRRPYHNDDSSIYSRGFADSDRRRKRRNWKWIKFFILGLIIALLFLPYRYHTGGEITLLPPKQQEIQAEVNAYIRQVFFKGGDGVWIKAGTVIATMEAADIKNSFLTTKERIQEQQALLKKQQADLDKLLAGSRQEEIDIAKQKVGVAQEELAVSKEQLEQANVESELTGRRAARFEQLYRDGAVSLQQSEDNKRLAETARTSRETAAKNVDAVQKRLDEANANLELVLSGARREDIEAARQEVAATRARIRRLEQDFNYLESQLQLTQIVMPFDGKLITPYLEQKVGSYLEKGDTFSVVQNDKIILGEVAVPEFQVGEISINGKVFAKLSAYPNRNLIGRVLSIEPNAIELSYGRVVNVLVELPNSEEVLKPGMSGYAKIEGRVMPVIVAFTRGIIRFVLVEVWSWFP